MATQVTTEVYTSDGDVPEVHPGCVPTFHDKAKPGILWIVDLDTGNVVESYDPDEWINLTVLNVGSPE